jgi:hypothetical protein
MAIFAFPFYFLGEVGYQDLFWWLVFSIRLAGWFDRKTAMFLLAYAFSSPAVLIDLASGSDIIANSLIVIVCGSLVFAAREFATFAAASLVFGLAVATRFNLIFALPFLAGALPLSVHSSPFLSERAKTHLFVLLAMTSAIAVTMIAIGVDPELAFSNGPVTSLRKLGVLDHRNPSHVACFMGILAGAGVLVFAVARRLARARRVSTLLWFAAVVFVGPFLLAHLSKLVKGDFGAALYQLWDNWPATIPLMMSMAGYFITVLPSRNTPNGTTDEKVARAHTLLNGTASWNSV